MESSEKIHLVVLILVIFLLGIYVIYQKVSYDAELLQATYQVQQSAQAVGKCYANIQAQRIETQENLARAHLVDNLAVVQMPASFPLGRPDDGVIGVRNNATNPQGDRVCFAIEVRCLRPFTPGHTCLQVTSDPVLGYDSDPVVVGGYDFDKNVFVSKDRPNNNLFRNLLSQFDVKNNALEINPATMQILSMRPDRYQMELAVYKANDNRECARQTELSNSTMSPYASQIFILQVV